MLFLCRVGGYYAGCRGMLDYDRRQVTVGGKAIHTTQTEFNILFFLSQHCGKVMTYSAIIGAIWGIKITSWAAYAAQLFVGSDFF